MTVISFKQAKVVYEDDTLDTESVIVDLLADEKLDTDGADECRAITITQIDTFDDDGDVTICYCDQDDQECVAYYSNHDGEERVWTDLLLYFPNESLNVFFTEIGRNVSI